jgi:phage tail protein X
MAEHPPDRTWRRTWRTLGIVVAVLAACTGLAVVGYVVLVMVAMSSYGSNK